MREGAGRVAEPVRTGRVGVFQLEHGQCFRHRFEWLRIGLDVVDVAAAESVERGGGGRFGDGRLRQQHVDGDPGVVEQAQCLRRGHAERKIGKVHDAFGRQRRLELQQQVLGRVLEAGVALVAEHQFVIDEVGGVGQHQRRRQHLDFHARRGLQFDKGARVQGVGAGFFHGVAIVQGAGKTGAGAGAAGQVGRNRHHHAGAQGQLVGRHTERGQGGHQRAADVGPRGQLHAGRKAQALHIEIAVVHDLLQVGRHLGDLQIVVGGGDRNDGVFHRRLAKYFLHIRFEQGRHRHGFIQHQQESLLLGAAGKKVQLQGAGLGGIAAAQAAAAGGFFQGADQLVDFILHAGDRQAAQHFFQGGRNLRPVVGAGKRNKDHDIQNGKGRHR